MATVDYNAMSEADFRAMLREFIAAECPPNLRFQARLVKRAEMEPWVRKLSAQGWLAPAWPVEFGGMGLSPEKLVAYHDELDAAGVARGSEMSVNMLGMLIIKHGTPAQQAHYLPRILRIEDIWCQGYSEPGAGSDLASLRTKAVLEGHEWVINGQKIWTSRANDSTDMFLLARTDPEAKKQEGISFFLLRMDTPGVTVRTIRTLAGEDDFAEVFFENVRVPKENIVGPVNGGWSVAKALMGFERITIGSPMAAQLALLELEKLGRATGAFANAAFVDTFTRLHLDVQDHIATYERFAQTLKRGGALGPEVSILKIWVTETFQAITETMLEWSAEHAAVRGGVTLGADTLDPLGRYWMARPASIYAGTNQIQRNILAKAVLGLAS
ncbi:acyl-CoA dehydrogenase family protein [Ramlibacter sp.]|uniref:acyl-CoA dehydrogenase family protein n=1 Tax=Ramlibacter sp. TaxID=1917967 RepID=UPI003D09D26D